MVSFHLLLCNYIQKWSVCLFILTSLFYQQEFTVQVTASEHLLMRHIFEGYVTRISRIFLACVAGGIRGRSFGIRAAKPRREWGGAALNSARFLAASPLVSLASREHGD